MTRDEFNTLGNMVACNTWRHPDIDKHPEENVDHSNQTFFWWMQQHQEEFWSMLNILSNREAKTVLEVGSSHGGCITFYDRLVGQDGLVIGVELNPKYAFSVQKTGKNIATAKQELIVADSTKPTTVEKVREVLGSRPLDFLFIDGDHTYQGAKSDWEMYSPLVRPGGIIGFHDVAIMPETKQVFDETNMRREILPVFYMGIGLVYKDNKVSIA